jgi:probable HAF family extracellular repeat protein
LLGTLAAGTCQAQKYTVTKLQTLPGGTNTSAARMNKAGEVVGSADDVNGQTQAVAWIDGAPTIVAAADPNPPGSGSYAEAVAINNQGVIVGDGSMFGAGAPDSVFEIGPNVSGSNAILRGINVTAINDSNVIVGQWEGVPAIWDGVDLDNNSGGLETLQDGSYSQPTGINAAGVVVGTEYDFLPPDYINTHDVAVRWEPDPITHTPGASVNALGGLSGINSGASAVNANDWVVGWATLANGWQRAVLWERGNGAFDLGTLGGHQSSANGINVEGDVAGQAQTASGAQHAVLWTHLDFKATDLNQEISPTLAKEFTLTSAVDTNDRCMVLANGVDNRTGAQVSFVLSLASPAEQSHCN